MIQDASGVHLRWRRAGVTALTGLVIVGALAGCAADAKPAGSATATAISAASASAGPATAAATAPIDRASTSVAPVKAPVDAGTAAIPAPAGRAGGPAPATPPGLRPDRLTIPAIGVSSSLESLGIGSGGIVDVPKNPDRPGWLDRSPAPGQQGPAVIIGHLDSKTGPAVFLRLRDLKVGDPVVVTRHDGTTVTFTVDGVQTFTKAHFPTEATYGPVPGPALRLITCGGTYDHASKSYESNVIVFAS